MVERNLGRVDILHTFSFEIAGRMHKHAFLNGIVVLDTLTSCCVLARRVKINFLQAWLFKLVLLHSVVAINDVYLLLIV